MKTKLSLISSLLFLALFAVACGSRPAAANSGSGPVEDYASLVDAL